MTKWDGKIPFDEDGNLVDYVSIYNRNKVIWKDNFEFEATMKIKNSFHGRSSAGFIFQDITTKNNYNISLYEFSKLIMSIFEGHIAGKWTFTKRGQNFLLISKDVPS